VDGSPEGDGAWMLRSRWTCSQGREEEVHGHGGQPPPAPLSWGEFIVLPLALRTWLRTFAWMYLMGSC